LAGALAGQAALFGLLAWLRDLDATLLLVERLADEPRWMPPEVRDWMTDT